METILVESIKPKKIITNTLKGTVMELENGDILKLFGSIYDGEDYFIKLLEKKIELLHSYNHISGIVIPKEKVFCEETGKFVGYTMDKTPGVSFPELHENLPLSKLRKISYLTELYLKIEEIVKKINENGIIVPDIATMNNIMVDDRKNMSLIDCDSWQVGPYMSLDISTLLGKQEQYGISKYTDPVTGLLKNNLDKKSLALMYFVTVPGILLEETIRKHGELLGFTTTQSIEYIFAQLGLDDVDFQHKIWKMYQPDGDNEYIGDDVRRISENYVLTFEKNNKAVRNFKKR